MRGYEQPTQHTVQRVWTGYESPCGVMSIEKLAIFLANEWLRIPMRGYEPKQRGITNSHQLVTNPHAGL